MLSNSELSSGQGKALRGWNSDKLTPPSLDGRVRSLGSICIYPIFRDSLSGPYQKLKFSIFRTIESLELELESQLAII
jgi:hypothetical protein